MTVFRYLVVNQVGVFYCIQPCHVLYIVTYFTIESHAKKTSEYQSVKCRISRNILADEVFEFATRSFIKHTDTTYSWHF